MTHKVSVKNVRQQLADLLNRYYNDSFAQMVCDYIQTTGMRKQEVENLLDEIKNELNQYDCKRMNTN